MSVLCCAACLFYFGVSDQRFQSFAVKENWSVTVLFFYSGFYLGLVYFAASSCVFWFYIFFYSYILLSSTSPEVPKDSIFYFSVLSQCFLCLSCGKGWLSINTHASLQRCLHIIDADGQLISSHQKIIYRFYLLLTYFYLTCRRPCW